MKNSVLGLFAVLVSVTFLVVSCNSKYPGFEMTKNGLYYKIHTQGTDTAVARIGDILSIEMQYFTAKDSMFSESPDGQPFDVPMMASTYKGDIFEGFGMLHKGDSATFILSADSFFLKTVGAPYLPPYIDSNSIIKINVKVVNIQNQKQIEEKKAKEAKEMALVENDKIQKFITENNITQSPDASGVYFIEKKAGNGAQVEKGKYAVIQFIGEILGGTTFGNTYETKEPVNYMVGTGRLGIGFDECIMKMKKGGKALMVIPSAMAFGGEGNGYMIPPYATLKVEVEVVDIVTEQDLSAKKEAEAKAKQAKEQGEIKKLIQKKYPKAKMTESGLYYNEEKAGTGKLATSGSKVKVHYLGTLLDGTKFDSSYDRKAPFEFTIGRGEVIPGWDEGVAMMKEGGKATLIIPSKLGYGPAGSGPIPPFSTLVFEVELISAAPSPLK